jgi:hypothetical protein
MAQPVSEKSKVFQFEMEHRRSSTPALARTNNGSGPKTEEEGAAFARTSLGNALSQSGPNLRRLCRGPF